MSVFRILWNLPANTAILLVRCYQLTLSHVIGRQCRFRPTCSHYYIHAVQRYGLWKGSWMGAKRIARCHPWHPGGEDPIWKPGEDHPPGRWRT